MIIEKGGRVGVHGLMKTRKVGSHIGNLYLRCDRKCTPLQTRIH